MRSSMCVYVCVWRHYHPWEELHAARHLLTQAQFMPLPKCNYGKILHLYHNGICLRNKSHLRLVQLRTFGHKEHLIVSILI